MKDKIGWDMLFMLIMEDILRNRMTENMENLLGELDENLKGIAMNGQGIGIDFEEIRKAESMYDKEKESK
jgi:hypothetical protein|tara:strand:- start:962 stop:1171 length:210 start_codon:yes stop_codon:yes gene_type:complete